MWTHGFMARPAGVLVLVACALVLIVPVRWLLKHAMHWRIRTWSARAGQETRVAVAKALIPPIRFVPVALAVAFAIHVVSGVVAASPRVKAIAAEIDRSLFVLLVFWTLYQAMAPLFSAFYGRAQLFSHAMIDWSVRVGRIIVVALGIAAILEIWGIRVGPILAGLGLFGVAAGLGAQDLVKNLIAGMFIIGEKRFKNGDWIRADHIVDGTVENVGLRATRVRGWDMAPVYVPNAKLADNAVTNFGQMPYRRISWVVGLEYRTTVDQLRRIRDGIEAYILGNEAFARPPEAPWTFVRVDKLGDSSIDLMVYCFSRTTDWSGWLQVKEDLLYAIKRIVEEAGSGFAFPSRSLYLEAVPSGTGFHPSHRQQASTTEPARTAP